MEKLKELTWPAAIEVHVEIGRDKIEEAKTGFRIVLSTYKDCPKKPILVFWKIKRVHTRSVFTPYVRDSQTKLMGLIELATASVTLWQDESTLPFYRKRLFDEDNPRLSLLRQVSTGNDTVFVGANAAIDWREYTVFPRNGELSFRQLPWGIIREDFTSWTIHVLGFVKANIEKLGSRSRDIWEVGESKYHTFYPAPDFFDFYDVLTGEDIDIRSDELVRTRVAI